MNELLGNIKKYPTPEVTPTREEFHDLPFKK